MSDPEPHDSHHGGDDRATTHPGARPPHLTRGEHPLLQRLARQQQQQQQQQPNESTSASTWSHGELAATPEHHTFTTTDEAPRSVTPAMTSAALSGIREPVQPSTFAGSTSGSSQRVTARRTPVSNLAAGGGGSGSGSNPAPVGAGAMVRPMRSPTHRSTSSGLSVADVSMGGAGSIGVSSAAGSPVGHDGDARALRLQIRVPGILELVPVSLPPLIDDACNHRDTRAGSGAATAAGSSGAGSIGTASLTSSFDGTTAPRYSDATGPRPATAAELGDVFVPVVQTTLIQRPELATMTAVGGGGAASAHDRYTADAGAFEPVRWQFAHRGEFLRPGTVLHSRVRDGDTLHALFTPIAAAEQRRRAAAAAVAAARGDGAARGATAAAAGPVDVADILRALQAVAGTLEPSNNAAATAGLGPAAPTGAAAGGPATGAGGGANTVEALRRQRDALVALFAALDARDPGGEGGPAAGASARGHRASSATGRAVEELWDEDSVADYMHAKWRLTSSTSAMSPVGTATVNVPTGNDARVGGPSVNAAPYDPLRDRDPHAGQRAMRLFGGDEDVPNAAAASGDAAAVRGSLLPGTAAATRRDIPQEMRRYLTNVSGPGLAFCVCFLFTFVLGPLNLLLLADQFNAPTRMLTAMVIGGLMNVFLTFFGGVEYGFTAGIQ
jgi:hypothetical protein